MSNSAADEASAIFNQHEKPSQHPEDAQHPSSPSEPSSDVDVAPTADMPGIVNPAENYFLPRNTNFDANTGPKGVIADLKSFEKARRMKWRSRNQESANLPADPQQPRPKSRKDRDSRSSSPSAADDDDADFMNRWRRSRLSELKGRDIRSRRSSPSKRRYGSLLKVDAVGYLDAIEKVSKDTIVIVCIYDDESQVSHQVEDCLGSLARKHETTRFVKLHYEEAEMDVASVPAILAYKAGDLIANLVGILDELPQDRALSSSSLEVVLQKHQLLE